MDLISANALISRTEDQEKSFEDLQDHLNHLTHVVETLSQNESSQDVEATADLNARLKLRLKHLQTALQERITRTEDSEFSTIQKLEALFEVAVLSIYPDVEQIPKATSICDARHGDYQCNNAMQLLQWLKKVGKQENPGVIAEKLIAAIPKNDIIAKSKFAPSGFINITLNANYVSDRLVDLMRKYYPPPSVPKKLKVIVDYSSPNIAKEMHVGHLRSTIIGDSIGNLMEFLGHDVLRLNHLGDWGTQFGMLIAHLKDKFPNYLTVSPPIGDLQIFYKEAKVRFDSDEEFKKLAYACVVDLQSHSANAIKAWKMICDVSYKEFTKVYERLSISNKLIIRGESFYHDLMKEVIQKPEIREHLQADDGRQLLFVPNCQIPLIMVKSDGGFTYDTSDMACIWHRLKVEKCDWNIYVIDNGQSLHVDTFIKAATFVGWYDPQVQKCQHVAFGLVLGEDKKKFKTRSGDTVRLVDLLDEGLSRATAKLKEKNRHEELTSEEFNAARDAIAYGCIKYADLSHNRINDYVFSFDKMLDDRGNTAVYLLYAYTRISSISRNAGISLESLTKYLDEVKRIPLEQDKELKLAKKIIQFHEMLITVLDNLYMNYVCDYLYELSCAFSEFYDNCYCIEKDRQTGKIVKIHYHRLCLCEATAGVMKRCFDILGIRPVGKM